MSTRTQDTVYVFYVKAEQTDAHEIIENQVSLVSVIFAGMNEPYWRYSTQSVLMNNIHRRFCQI